MRLAFMGTPPFAAVALEALHQEGHDIAAVYTQPPRPAGRGKKLLPSAVQERAEQWGLIVRSPKSLKSEDAQAEFRTLELDCAVVAAYGLILPRAILDAPRWGCLNIHGSLLPRWRGAAPIERAILAGDEMTGITIMQMEAGLDTGPMLAKSEVPIADKTAGQLTEQMAAIGGDLVCDVLANLAGFPPETQPQDGVTYAEKITKEEAQLDFAAGAVQAERQVRAFNPRPGAFFLHDGERYRVHAADIIATSGAPGTVLDDHLTIGCGDDALRPTLIQRAGKPKMALDDFLRGNRFAAGTVLAD